MQVKAAAIILRQVMLDVRAGDCQVIIRRIHVDAATVALCRVVGNRAPRDGRVHMVVQVDASAVFIRDVPPDRTARDVQSALHEDAAAALGCMVAGYGATLDSKSTTLVDEDGAAPFRVAAGQRSGLFGARVCNGQRRTAEHLDYMPVAFH